MGGKTAKDYAGKYTKPKLRERLKEQLTRSSKGARSGQWSARKSQMLTQRYEAEGGGYVGGKDEAQRSLEQWTEQDWKPRGGGTRARRRGTMHRYLPEKVWRMLSPAEQRKADRSKADADRRKKEQHVAWPKPVHDAMTAAGLTGDDPHDLTKSDLAKYARRLAIDGRSRMKKDELIAAIREQG